MSSFCLKPVLVLQVTDFTVIYDLSFSRLTNILLGNPAGFTCVTYAIYLESDYLTVVPALPFLGQFIVGPLVSLI